jgi:hypothetical protein
VETKKGKYRHNHDDEAYQINDAVHDYSPGLSVSRPVLLQDGLGVAGKCETSICGNCSRRGETRPTAGFPINDQGLRGATVDLGFGHRSQLLIRRLFFFQGCVEKTDDVVSAEVLRPSDKSAIAGHLVVLDSLSRRD